MFVNRISIHRDGYYGGYTGAKPKGNEPYKCTIEVQGQNGKVELNLSEEMSAKIVAVIADEVADAGRRTAEAMTAAVINGAALPAPVAA